LHGLACATGALPFVGSLVRHNEADRCFSSAANGYSWSSVNHLTEETPISLIDASSKDNTATGKCSQKTGSPENKRCEQLVWRLRRNDDGAGCPIVDQIDIHHRRGANDTGGRLVHSFLVGCHAQLDCRCRTRKQVTQMTADAIGTDGAFSDKTAGGQQRDLTG
jgi:hypothetical protein